MISLKPHLTNRIQPLTYEEFETIIQIEGILNSRAISPMSTDNGNFEALIPGHFLIEHPISSIPKATTIDVPDNRLKARS